ncbi:MAG TPA: glycine cleavage system aminomethyltransferase GcvT [Gammaproteobacteria bacterium]|nr:glycine cleavage system aminomethyltransferase GcvT [Gammaproteobacteria bacterium]
MLDTRKTPLYEAHLRAGAKLVDFAGWSMPLHYGSQVEEHHAVRRGAGVFDVSHMGIVDLAGEGSSRFLRRLLANDPAKLKRPGRALYTCMLNGRGGIVDDLIVYRLGEEEFRLVVNAATRDKDLTWLRGHADALAMSLTPREDLSQLAVQGPRAGEALGKTMPLYSAALTAMRPFDVIQFADESWAARTGYTGEDGWELMLPIGGARQLWRELLESGVTPCGLGARDTLRLEAGLKLYGQDMDDEITPFECGLGWTVAMEPTERRFTGRDVLETAEPRARFTGFLLEGPGVLRSGQTLVCRGGSGIVTSGGYSPTLARSIGLGRIPIASGNECEVEIRGKTLRVRCVEPPFVRRGRILVE